ncbi:MAG: MoxR family ATPase [Gemmatirosa sp.]|nr:MoxR family ATPase [Gemmatirosa sp.]
MGRRRGRGTHGRVARAGARRRPPHGVRRFPSGLGERGRSGRRRRAHARRDAGRPHGAAARRRRARAARRRRGPRARPRAARAAAPALAARARGRAGAGLCAGGRDAARGAPARARAAPPARPRHLARLRRRRRIPPLGRVAPPGAGRRRGAAARRGRRARCRLRFPARCRPAPSRRRRGGDRPRAHPRLPDSVTDPTAPTPFADPPRTDLARVTEALGRVRDAVARRVVGQDAAIDDALVAVLARGHVLLEGVPGVAKTLLVRTLADALGARFGRIQFTPDLMPSDVTGVSVLRAGSSEATFEFHPGPVFTDLLLADEINRAPAKTQSALLEAMQERQVTVEGVARPLGTLFTVFATQNPVEYEGTYPLPEAQLDRFLLKVLVPYPSHEAERAMLDRHAEGFDPERSEPLPAVLDADSLRALRDAVDGVRVAPEVRDYVVALVRATRDDAAVTLGASPRATVALLRAARAAALLAERDFVTPDDVKALAPAVLRHRLRVAPELEVDGRSADDVIQSLLMRVPAPQ